MTKNNSYRIISYEKLINALESDTTDNCFKIAAEFLDNALRDWPTLDLKEPIDLIAELKKEISDSLTHENLNEYSKRLDLGDDAWKAESISSLLEMFDFDRKSVFDKTIELESIIDKITRHYQP